MEPIGDMEAIGVTEVYVQSTHYACATIAKGEDHCWITAED